MSTSLSSSSSSSVLEKDNEMMKESQKRIDVILSAIPVKQYELIATQLFWTTSTSTSNTAKMEMEMEMGGEGKEGKEGKEEEEEKMAFMITLVARVARMKRDMAVLLMRCILTVSDSHHYH